MNSIVLLEHTVKLLKTTPRFKNNPMLDYRFLRGNYWWGMHRFPSASSIAYLFIFLSVDSFIFPLASLSSRISFFCYQSSAARFPRCPINQLMGRERRRGHIWDPFIRAVCFRRSREFSRLWQMSAKNCQASPFLCSPLFAQLFEVCT